MIHIKSFAGRLSKGGDTFVDGAVIAAARTLPTWSNGDLPPTPSMERKAVKDLQEECKQMLAEFPTTSKQDQKILGMLTALTLEKNTACIIIFIDLAFLLTRNNMKNVTEMVSIVLGHLLLIH